MFALDNSVGTADPDDVSMAMNWAYLLAPSQTSSPASVCPPAPRRVAFTSASTTRTATRRFSSPAPLGFEDVVIPEPGSVVLLATVCRNDFPLRPPETESVESLEGAPTCTAEESLCSSSGRIAAHRDVAYSRLCAPPVVKTVRVLPSNPLVPHDVCSGVETGSRATSDVSRRRGHVFLGPWGPFARGWPGGVLGAVTNRMPSRRCIPIRAPSEPSSRPGSL